MSMCRTDVAKCHVFHVLTDTTTIKNSPKSFFYVPVNIVASGAK